MRHSGSGADSVGLPPKLRAFIARIVGEKLPDEAEAEGEAGLTLFGALRHHAPLVRCTPLDQIALSIPPLPTPQSLPSMDEGGDEDVTGTQERGLLHGVQRLATTHSWGRG